MVVANTTGLPDAPPLAETEKRNLRLYGYDAVLGDRDPSDALPREAPEQMDTVITENLIRRFWVGYQALMGY